MSVRSDLFKMQEDGTEPHYLFIGRWQPFHNGHKYIIDAALKTGHKVCIAIRTMPQNSKNPYPALTIFHMINAVYGDNKNVDIIIIPNIEMVCVGRGVGYMISNVPQEIEDISATKIRRGERDDVPDEVKEVIKKWETIKDL